MPGVDGRKMSKSFDNAIYMSDDDAAITAKMMAAITDPARQRRADPGNPEVCNIFAYHQLYTKPERIAQIDTECRRAGIGCVECKKECVANAVAYWKPIRERRAAWEKQPAKIKEIVHEGSANAREIAEGNMPKVREALGVSYASLRR